MTGTELRCFSHFEILTKIAELFKLTKSEVCLHHILGA